MKGHRLNRFLARAGVGSLRGVERLIAEGRVRVDGQVVREPWVRVEPGQRVEVDGRVVEGVQELEYWVVNKPKGVVCTLRDPHNPRRIVDLLPAEVRGLVYPVGRLDKMSEGLVILTNDGALAHRLMHPSFGVERIYRVWVKGRLSRDVLRRLREGVAIGPAEVGRVKAVTLKGFSRGVSKLRLVMTTGRKREIRRMFEALGHPVLRLVRTRMGPVSLGGLGPGQGRALTRAEVAALRRAVRLEVDQLCGSLLQGEKRSTQEEAG